MKNILRLSLLGLLFLFPAVTFSKPTFSQSISQKFIKQWIKSPQEKLYLQTDKPYYSAGENIWFKGYVVNAAILLPNNLSQFIYVELIDKSNAVINRVKIKKDSLGFSGYINLKPELSSGNYTLRAYTFWMQNSGTDFFLTKNIFIGNAIDDFVSSEICFGKTIDSKTPVTVRFIDASKKPISGKTVDVDKNWGKDQGKKISLTTNKEGKISWLITTDSTDHTMKIINASISEPGIKYKTHFFLPEFNSEFDVQFFPESGTFLTGNLQTIAFKAIGPDGLSINVTGKVYSDKNVEVADLSTYNKGMGKFIMEPDSGSTYYALVKNDNGLIKRFNFPVPQTVGVALHLVYNRGKILYEVYNQTAIPNKSLFLLVHSRGRMLVTQPLFDSSGQISEALLPPGIVSFSVIDSTGNTYCERICFVHNLMPLSTTMKADKAVYGKREPVKLDFNIQSALGKSCEGNFSVSVTDSKTVTLDTLSDNIISNLLLSSDLKGYIEDPASYFVDNSISTREKMDILMLTQGWRRFSTPDVVKGIYKDDNYYVEAGQALSGKVLNLFNKPSKDCGVIMFSPYKSMIKLAQTDSLGHYLIDGIEFPDSTSFVLKAKKKKTFGDVEIIPDVDEFPKSIVFIPIQHKKDSMNINDYLQQSKQKYYTDGGMRVVNLGEVVVNADAKKPESETHYYSGLEDTKFTSERLDQYPGMSVFDILTMVAGVQVNGDQVSIRGGGSPLFLIDDIEAMSSDEISYLTTNDIEEISVFKGASASIFGSRGGNGVIAISLKKGVVRKAEAPISLTNITPLGYQKPIAFYCPKYEIDSVRLKAQMDLRTTIYWNPKLVADSIGTVHVKFFTADRADNYSVILEGITNKGEICRYVGILRREGE